MKKITLLLLFIFFSITGYSQFTEGFENTTGPDALPSTNWTLGSGNWAVFDNAVGTAQRWGNAPVATPSNAYQGNNAAYINRENLGTEGLISQDYLATPLVTIPANGQLRFFARSFTSGNQGTLYQIRVAPATASQTNPAAYTTLVQQWDETTLNTTFNVYEEKIVDLTAFATQQVYVSFVRVHTQLPGGLNGAGDRWLVDNINIVQQCLDPTTLTFSAVTQNGASLNWANPSGATSWEIEVILATATPTGTGVIYNGPLPYVVTGLLANTAYKFYVRAICNTGYSSQWSVASATFTTGIAPPECGGNFVDAGGTTANYPNSSNTTTTICPTVPGDKVTVTFTTFNTEATWDGLYVYDGNGVVPANLIASANPAGNVPGGLAGSYWGTTIPGPFTSSAVDGCLTFVFRSDASVNNPGWVANITCAPPPACQQPAALVSSAETSNSATLAWTNVGVATTWEVIALPCGSPAPTAGTTGWTTTSTNPYVFTGLTPATCYDLYVRGNCSSTSNGVSLWAGPRTITTLVAPPVCGGNFFDAGGPTANYLGNSNDTTIICPTVPGDKVTVTFTSFNTEANWDGLYVYNGNGVVPANLIASANPAANVPGGLAGSYWGTTIPGPFTSSAVDGCLTFVFRSDGAVNNPGWVSNVTCGPPPVCQQPAALVSSAVTSNSATLAWTNVGVATTWEVIALPCGSPAPTAATTGWTTTSTNPYVFIGLTPATCYDLYVRGNCSSTSNGVSLWSGPRTVTTLVAPPVCGGNFVDAGGPTANYPNNSNDTTTICPTNPGEIVTVTFTSFNTEVNWDGLYVYDGNAVVPANLIASANPAANVPGGLAGSYWGTTIPGPFTSTTSDGCLTFVFRSDGSVNNPGWVSNVTCSPAPTCARPTLVTASNVTQTSAQISWTQPLNPNGSLASAWEVLILPAGSAVPTTNGIPATSPYLATGLSAGTAYVFYVRAICSATDNSTWSALNFAALPVNDECANATFAIVNQNLNCVQTTPGTLSGATGSSQTTTCPGVADDDVWFTFTATAVTHVISFTNISLPAPVINYAIYSGSDCNALTQVGCNSGANLIPGTTYYLRVYSSTAVAQFTTFNLCIGTLPCSEAPAFCTGQTVTYANATNVPSLGQIGCLFTSPNPAFFFLQVNQAGPLSYLISQVDTNGIPRDVDYVAWGPFTDLNTACSGVPANPLPGLTPALTPAGGCQGTLHACSYSSAPTEIMCIPNAQLCQVYVIMITNFSNQSGTVTFTQTNTGGGTTECFPINTFNYPQTYYCQDGVNPTPVLAPGASAGTYTSTVGLVINPVTGVIDLAASTPGPYIVTSTTLTSTGGVCTTIPSITTSRTVIITAPASATITYPATTYCNSITSITNPIQTGTNGGVYSASPSGLLINSVTGGILPVSSSPGIYTITYTIPAFGGCLAFSTTTTVEILPAPIPTFTQVAPICPGDMLADLPTISNNNITGTWSPAMNNTATTTYTFTPTTGICARTTTMTIAVGTTTPDFTQVAPICPNAPLANLPTTSINGVLGTWSPPLDNTTTTTYTFTPSPEICASVVTMTIQVLPLTIVPTFANIAPICPNGVLAALPTTSNNGITGIWSPALDNTTTTTYTFTPDPAQCALTTTLTIIVNPELVVTVNSPSFCPGSTATVTATPAIPGTYTYAWTVPAGFPDPGNVASFTTSTVGDYSVVITQVSSFCNTDFESPLATGVSPNLFNENLVPCWDTTSSDGIIEIWPPGFENTFAYSGNQLIELNGNFPGALFQDFNVIPGTSISVSFAHRGRQGNDVVGVEIGPLGGPYVSLGNFTDGNTAWVLHSLNYTIPTGAGNNYTLRFVSVSAAGGSPSIGNLLDSISISSLSCPSQPATGTVSLQTLSGPTVTVTQPTCTVQSGTIEVTSPIGSVTDYEYSLDSGTYQPGATFTNVSPGVTHTITVHDLNTGCFSLPFDVIIDPVPQFASVTTISYATPVCQNATTNPVPDTSAAGFTSGGVFSSTTGLAIDPTTGVINLANTTAGTYLVTYAVANNTTTCQLAGSSTFTIVINPIITPVTGFSYTSPICKNGTNPIPIPVSGFTTGGSYTSTTGLSINSTTGVIDLANSAAGAYTVTYTVAANVATCQVGNNSTASITINPVITPVTTISYPSPVCAGDTNPLPNTSTTGFTIGGTYSSTTGLSLNALTGEINLSTTTPGTYTVTYTVGANVPTCQIEGSSTTQIVIVAPIEISVEGGCQSANYVLTALPINNSFNPETVSYIWQNASGQTVGTNSQSTTVTEIGIYTVTITSNGCDTESLPVNVDTIACVIQKGISVNNDGKNDSFDLTGFNVKNLSIFNRYGEKVYTFKNYTNQWAGQSDNGEELPDGTYYYVINRDNGEIKTGWVYINRAQ